MLPHSKCHLTMGGHKRCYFTGAAERLREGISTRAVMVDMLRPAVPRVDYHNDDGDDDAVTVVLMTLMILMTGKRRAGWDSEPRSLLWRTIASPASVTLLACRHSRTHLALLQVYAAD